MIAPMTPEAIVSARTPVAAASADIPMPTSFVDRSPSGPDRSLNASKPMYTAEASCTSWARWSVGMALMRSVSMRRMDSDPSPSGAIAATRWNTAPTMDSTACMTWGNTLRT